MKYRLQLPVLRRSFLICHKITSHVPLKEKTILNWRSKHEEIEGTHKDPSGN
jgi:hypothetical protein